MIQYRTQPGSFMYRIPSLLVMATLVGGVSGKDETIRYLRPGPKGFVEAARFVIRQEKDAWSMESITGGAKGMHIRARYDRANRLLAASAVLGDDKAEAVVKMNNKKASIHTKGMPVQEFAVDGPVIVTSAPDWSDLFLLCRNYDVKKSGKQTTAGLWFHPNQKSQLLKFTIEPEGTEEVVVAEKMIRLTRFRIRIRGPSTYLAWADVEGMLIKLTPLPFRAGSGLIRAGWEGQWEKIGASR